MSNRRQNSVPGRSGLLRCSGLPRRCSVLLAAFGIALPLPGCLWDRFEKLAEDAPVEALSVPTEVPSGFGSTLAMIAAGDATSVFVGGPPRSSGAAVFHLGEDEQPDVDAADRAHCQRGGASRTCALANQAAGLALAPGTPERRNCYLAGPGQKDGVAGLFGRCAGGEEFVFPVPPDVEQAVVVPLVMGSIGPVVSLAADPEQRPVVLAGVGELGRAFYYESDSLVPVDLMPAEPPPSTFGATVAVVRTTGGRLLAVGAPGSDQVRLFASDGSGPVAMGCLAGPAGFGRTLAAGDLDGDGEADLAVADADSVEVYSGAGLAALSPLDDASCNLALPQVDLLLAQAGCAAGNEVEGCQGADFGRAIQVADFDGDGRGEIAVSGPGLTVRGVSAAGAVQVFDAAGALVDVRFPSDGVKGGHFGEVMVAVPQAGRSILVVGEPGAESASVVYCTLVLGAELSPRCP